MDGPGSPSPISPRVCARRSFVSGDFQLLVQPQQATNAHRGCAAAAAAAAAAAPRAAPLVAAAAAALLMADDVPVRVGACSLHTLTVCVCVCVCVCVTRALGGVHCARVAERRTTRHRARRDDAPLAADDGRAAPAPDRALDGALRRPAKRRCVPTDRPAGRWRRRRGRDARRCAARRRRRDDVRRGAGGARALSDRQSEVGARGTCAASATDARATTTAAAARARRSNRRCVACRCCSTRGVWSTRSRPAPAAHGAVKKKKENNTNQIELNQQ